ncbi:MAG: hypothetical protein K8R40_09390 [Anaerolineaceae bacterium]|nr:hypothetical protein [Anaerolineaceae bacterium]
MSITTANQNKFTERIKNAGNATTVFGILIVGALLFFELFNYSTTHFALGDLLGEQKILGIQWATTLSIAFCAIDFAGISRMFTSEEGTEEPKEIWYLFGAWLLAATMNAMLTWWGVSMAIANHSVQSTAIVEAGTILKVVPIFVSILVWVIRVLVIGSISAMGSRFLWGQTATRPARSTRRASVQTAVSTARPSRATTTSQARAASPRSRNFARPESTYHSLNGTASNTNQGNAHQSQF